jgi:hypothetical protein
LRKYKFFFLRIGADTADDGLHVWQVNLLSMKITHFLLFIVKLHLLTFNEHDSNYIYLRSMMAAYLLGKGAAPQLTGQSINQIRCYAAKMRIFNFFQT